MQSPLDKVVHTTLERQLRRLRRRNFLRRYWFALLLLTVFAGYNGYYIYDKGPERWASDATEYYNHALELIEDSLTPDYSTAGEGGYFVTRVVDGDTIHVRDNRGIMKIRLHGIDTPERGQPYGGSAGKALAVMVSAEYVRVQEMDTDRYGRTVAKVYIGKTYVNKALVEQGYAWWYQRYAQADFRLGIAQWKARRANRGLWAEPDPVPPWEWRRQHR